MFFGELPPYQVVIRKYSEVPIMSVAFLILCGDFFLPTIIVGPTWPY